jgi:hypothetical protein
MRDNSEFWKKALLTLLAAALFTVGLAIIVYIGLARDRIVPTPTPRPVVIRPTAAPTDTSPASPSPSATPTEPNGVSGVVTSYEPGALIIVIEPLQGDVDQIIVPEGLIVVWENGQRASPREIIPGVTLYAQGPTDSLNRLIAERVVITAAAQVTATLTPAPTNTPRPTEPTGWRAEYFGNTRLEGAPVLTRVENQIDYQWGEGSPSARVPNDDFSARWRGSFYFAEGGYRLYAFTDDGVRVWVDGSLLIDQWHTQSATLSYSDIYLGAGDHDLQVEYFEAAGGAQARVWWDYQGEYPDWRGAYYNNTDLAGDPVLLRNDQDLEFDWGTGSPSPQVRLDQFSARWTRTVELEEGAYRFFARADDGVRLWVDGPMVIDEWHDSTGQTYTGYLWLDGGPHDLRVEYMERAGDAHVHVWWERIDTFAHWTAAYYANPDLAGRPVFLRDDERIQFDWGDGAPAQGLPVDNYSVRWSREITFEGGDYVFVAKADDGVRLYVDGEVVIDEWHDSSPTRYDALVSLTEGEHSVTVEYFERGGQAMIDVGWQRVATPTPTPSSTPTATPLATATVTPTVVPASPTPTNTPRLFTPTATAEPPTPTAAPPTETPTEAAPTATATTAPAVTPTATETPAAPDEPTATVELPASPTPTEAYAEP